MACIIPIVANKAFDDRATGPWHQAKPGAGWRTIRIFFSDRSFRMTEAFYFAP
ncbi:hypothetical protein [Paenibacillus amylolyticus]|uniref:hypothetical protein n=1 Tax=Paenibacillus amylolyticus TaxID=1451 RepID=UPI00201D73BE|nr:hypothetical protein [Paenibacillus amylolyticus]MCL6658646.1 hypothetical protein [Paenibacillus amylolyticus]